MQQGEKSHERKQLVSDWKSGTFTSFAKKTFILGKAVRRHGRDVADVLAERNLASGRIFTRARYAMKYPGAAEEFVRIWIEYGQEAAANAIDAVEARYGHETATALLLSILQILDNARLTNGGRQ